MDFDLKHRVTGAAILIAVGVLIASIVLDEPEPPPPDVARGPIGDDGDDSQAFVSRVTPIGGKLERRTPADAQAAHRGTEADEASAAGAAAPGTGTDEAAGASAARGSASATAAAAEAGPADGDAAAMPGQAVQAPAGAPGPSAEKESGAPDSRQPDAGSALATTGPSATEAAGAQPEQPAKRSPADSTELERGWVVRVGTYAQPVNVERLTARLREAGFEARTSVTVADGTEATRVWVGPYEKRVDAARVRARIEELIGQKGLITAYP